MLLGKSAAGKDTIQKELIKQGLYPVVPYTTRPMRKGERDGTTYHFISKEDFFHKQKSGFFAETTSYRAANNEVWHYGSAIEDLSDHKVMIINPEGLKALKDLGQFHIVSFYLLSNMESLQKRMLERGDDLNEARRRRKADKVDFANIDNYIDFSLRNDTGFNPAVLAKIILFLYKAAIGEK